GPGRSAVILASVINSVADSPDCFNSWEPDDGEIVVSKLCDGDDGEIVVSKLCDGDDGEIAVSKICDGTTPPGGVEVPPSESAGRSIMTVGTCCDSPLLVNSIVFGSDASALSSPRASSRAV